MLCVVYDLCWVWFLAVGCGLGFIVWAGGLFGGMVGFVLRCGLVLCYALGGLLVWVIWVLFAVVFGFCFIVFGFSCCYVLKLCSG